jgi:UDP-glucuronate 4-epimerase
LSSPARGILGYHVASGCSRGETVVGVTTSTLLRSRLKQARAERSGAPAGFRWRGAMCRSEPFAAVVRSSGADRIVHLAAQAGVRWSIDHPFDYQRANLAGHLSVLEAARATPGLKHLVYASSSSVYGDRPWVTAASARRTRSTTRVALRRHQALRRADERVYARLYGLPLSGLRFFTVYGPWGRADMAYWLFTKKILAGEPIEVFGGGRLARTSPISTTSWTGGGRARPPRRRRASGLLNIGDSRPSD